MLSSVFIWLLFPTPLNSTLSWCCQNLSSLLLKMSVVSADITISGKLFHTFIIGRPTPGNMIQKTFDGIFCSKLATGLESIIMVQAFRNTRLPKWDLTLKVKFGGQRSNEVKFSKKNILSCPFILHRVWHEPLNI